MTLPRIFYVATENSGACIKGIEEEHGKTLDVQLICAQTQYTSRFNSWPPLFDQLVAKSGGWPTRSTQFRGVSHRLMSETLPSDLTTILSIDRHNWSGANAMSIMQLVFKYLEIWDSLISDLRPDCVVFHDSPHWGSAHVLYQCCIARNIPTVCILNTLFRHRLIVRRSIHGANEHHAGWSCSREELEPSTYASYGIETQKWSRAITETHRVESRLMRVLSLEAIQTAVAYRPHSFPGVVPEEPVGPLKRFAFNLNTTMRIRRAVRFIAQHSRKALPSEPYVYFPLHLQPEATTVPLGGLYWDQLNVVRLLSSCLPPGWKLAVKEHPQMFRYNRRWPRARSLRFYEDLVEQPNVVLLDMTTKSGKAIENAQAVATITGTVGWEALNLGKPVLAFGAPWYHSFPGVVLVHSMAKPRAYLTELLGSSRLLGPAPREMEQALKDACERGAFMPGAWRDHTIGDSDSHRTLSTEYGIGISSYIRSIV